MAEATGSGPDFRILLSLVTGVPEDSFDCYAYLLAGPDGVMTGTNAATRGDLLRILLRAIEVTQAEELAGAPWPQASE